MPAQPDSAVTERLIESVPLWLTMSEAEGAWVETVVKVITTNRGANCQTRRYLPAPSMMPDSVFELVYAEATEFLPFGASGKQIY